MQAKASQAVRGALMDYNAAACFLLFGREQVSRPSLNPAGRVHRKHESFA